MFCFLPWIRDETIQKNGIVPKQEFSRSHNNKLENLLRKFKIPIPSVQDWLEKVRQPIF